MPTDHLLYEPGTIARIVFNNPARHNAVSLAMWQAADEAIAAAAADPATRVLIVTGAGGKAFVSGADISKFESERASEEAVRAYNDTSDRTYARLHAFPKPTIAAINGVAVGAGLVVALLADVSIISETARFTDGHTKLGVVAGDHAAILWPLLCGMAKAKYYLLLCEAVDGEEAERIGLVSLCVEDDQLEAKGVEVATKLAEGAQTSIRFTKYALNNWLRMMGPSFDASTALEMLGFMGPEVKEGLASHLEKRKPKFDPYSPL